jgi:hypothetical protein
MVLPKEQRIASEIGNPLYGIDLIDSLSKKILVLAARD